MRVFVFALLLALAVAVPGTNNVASSDLHDELLFTDSDSGDVAKNGATLQACLNACNAQATTCREGAACAYKFRPTEDFNGACQTVLTSCGQRCNENSNKVIECFAKCDAADGYCKTTAICAEKSGKVGFTEVCTANYASCNQQCEVSYQPKYGAFPTGLSVGQLSTCFAIFTASGTFTPSAANQPLNVLMIGGGSGGAGGHQAGGASGFLKVFSTSFPTTSPVTVTVGAGGAGAAAANDNSQFAATPGGQTCFGTVCTAGGGVVAGVNMAGGAGGSGGGGSGNAGLGAAGGSMGSAGANGNQPGGPGQGVSVWQEIFGYQNGNGIFVKGVGLAAGKGGAGGVSSHGGGGGGGGIIVNGQTPIAQAGADAARSGKGGEGYGAGGGAGGYHSDAAVRVAGGAGNAGVVVVNWC